MPRSSREERGEEVGGDPRHLLVLSKGIWWQPAAGQAQWYTAPPCTMSGCDVLALGAPTSTPTLRSSTPPGQRGEARGELPAASPRTHLPGSGM